MHILINEIQNHTTGGSGDYHREYDLIDSRPPG
jgi:hypothetical protein